MLKALLRKQFLELNAFYFQNRKTGKNRTRAGTVGFVILYIVLFVGLGFAFFMVANSLASQLVPMGYGWLCFSLMGLIALAFGIFGSVFNTYAGLYHAKDNELLLSMPIPPRRILLVRMIGVYAMSMLYSGLIMVPTIIAMQMAAPGAWTCVAQILLTILLGFVVLTLTCLLGWVVALISARLKNKSFITVLLSLLFIIGYYVFYFRAQGIISDLMQNALTYGAKIKGAAYVLYLFGRIGEGSWLAALGFLAVLGILAALLWHFMSRSFIGIATSSGAVAKVRYVEKTAKQQSAFRALLGKEIARFTSSANYMLNSGLGMLLIPAAGAAMLLKGGLVWEVLGDVFVSRPGSAAVLFCAALCMLTSMNNMTVASVSLEGRSVWIPQSLPVVAKQVLRAKIALQLVLTLPVMLFTAVCAAATSRTSLPQMLLIVLFPLIYTVFSAVWGLVTGLKMPIMNWTTETTPIKQSGAVMIVLFGTWAICVAFAGLYLLAGYRIGAELYLFLWAAVFTAVSLLLLKWLDTKGCRLFEDL